MSTTHGSPVGYNFGTLRSHYQIKTLVDISATGMISEYRKDVPLPFVDDLKNIINNQETWNISRNEQRNWETLVQCISIRAQPIMLKEPVVETVSISSMDFGYTGKHKVWTMEFGFELADIFKVDNDPISLLAEQLDIIPVLTDLQETVNLTTNTLATTGAKVNTLCYQIDI
jgi:hypothetical protein